QARGAVVPFVSKLFPRWHCAHARNHPLTFTVVPTHVTTPDPALPKPGDTSKPPSSTTSRTDAESEPAAPPAQLSIPTAICSARPPSSCLQPPSRSSTPTTSTLQRSSPRSLVARGATSAPALTSSYTRPSKDSRCTRPPTTSSPTAPARPRSAGRTKA